MVHVRTDPSYGGVELCKRNGDELIIGNANLLGIEYAFWRGKFSAVWIYVMGFTNWINLRDATFQKFGEGGQQIGLSSDMFGRGILRGCFLTITQY